MAPKYSSSSSSSAAGAMRASLVLVLLLTAVAAAHGRKVSCENKCSVPVLVNGILVGVGIKADIDVDLTIAVALIDKEGREHKGSWLCPPDVSAIELVYVDVYLQVKVKAVIFISKLLHTVLGLVLGTIKCVL